MDELYTKFVAERELIRQKKLAGDPWPWTEDPILQTYSFTNIRRMDDRVSQWLVDNWYGPNFGNKNMWFACCMARQINWPDTLAEVGFPDREYSPSLLEQALYARKLRGDKVYTGAYMLTGTLGGWKGHQTAFKILQPLWENPPTINTSYMEETHKAISGKYKGFSSFMAGQAVADMRHAIPGEWADRDTWAPVGPGSMRGLNRLYGRPVAGKVKQDQAVREFMEVQSELVPAHLRPTLELMDVQNTLCEFDKYIRTMNGEGTPRAKYRRK